MFGFFFLGLLTAILVALCLYTVSIYNNFVALTASCEKNWANIDVLLKQRHSELPNLVAVCKRYMEHEQETFKAITKARSEVFAATQTVSLKELGLAETILRNGISHLFGVIENYPELKANENFLQLQFRIVSLENQIADRREFYNEAVTILNTRTGQFPDLFIAKYCQFKRYQLLRFEQKDLEDLNMATLYNQGES